MKEVVRFTLAQKVLFNLLFVLLMVVGAFALFNSPVERYPNIEFGKAYINTYFPGASPRDVEALITQKVEDAVENLENLEYVRSTSYRERSSILVKFIDDTDYRAIYDEMRLKVQAIIDELPPEADPPRFTFIDVNMWQPTVSINLYGNRDNRTLTLMGEELKTSLRQITGVKEVKLNGEYQREFHIHLNPKLLSKLGITFDQAANALQSANVSIPAGDFTTDGGEFIIKVDQRFRQRQQVLDTIVRRDADGSFVKVSDLASSAYLSHQDPFVLTSVNGQDCVTLQIIKTPEANALSIVSEVRKIIKDYETSFSKESVSLILTQDSTVRIKDSMRVLGTNLLIGIFLVCLLIWYFMGFRNAALTTIGIPFAFLVTMVVLYFTGNSINEISLFAFVLVSGIIVDDAIVVVENIFRHAQMGKDVHTSIIDGTSEVFLPVVSATLTTCAAFLPMLIMTGSTGDFFAIIPKAVSFALLASVIECLFILPIHYLDYGPRPQAADHGKEEENIVMVFCRKVFDRLLKIALEYRFTTMALLFVAFAVAMFMAIVSISGRMNLIRVEFFPDDYSLYYVEVTGPAGTPIENTSELIKRLSVSLGSEGHGITESAVAFAGFYINDDYQPVWGNNLGHVVVTLPAKKKRKFADYPNISQQCSLGFKLRRAVPQLQYIANDLPHFFKCRHQKSDPIRHRKVYRRRSIAKQAARLRLGQRSPWCIIPGHLGPRLIPTHHRRSRVPDVNWVWFSILRVYRLIVPGVAGRIADDTDSHADAGFGDAMGSLTTNDEWRKVAAPGVLTGVVNGWTLRDGDLCCAVSGNIDWLQYEYADIQLKRDPAHALLDAYRRYGLDLLSVIGGRFSLFLWDSSNRKGLIACDRFGQMPVYWSRGPRNELVFGPTASSVNRLLGQPATLSEQGIFNYLYFHMVPGPSTAFQGVNKLLAAHALTAEDGNWQLRRYWEPNFREHADDALDTASEEMMGLLASSVARLAEGADTGAFLSGGLDSSTVAGLLARHKPNPKTYSIGFNADGYDEISYARLASERFGTDFKTYYVTPEDVLSELPKIAAAYDEPFGNSSALPAYFCARFASADGRERLLAGDGGDELFAGNERYAKQEVFEHYSKLPDWSRRFLLEPLLFKVLSQAKGLIGKARSYVEQAAVPLPDRLQSYNFLNRLGAPNIVTEDLWNTVDGELPLRLDRELYEHPGNASRLNRMLYLDWHHTLADNDLRKVNRMCQLAGIEVEYPMLDDRLVEFSTRVSSQRKMPSNKLRDFYKRSVKDFLPREIIDKPKHGFGLPFGVWMAEHRSLQELAEDNLSRMRRRKYVRAEFIDEVLRLHRDQHAGYYGEFIWILLMLELWLTAQGSEP